MRMVRYGASSQWGSDRNDSVWTEIITEMTLKLSKIYFIWRSIGLNTLSSRDGYSAYLCRVAAIWNSRQHWCKWKFPLKIILQYWVCLRFTFINLKIQQKTAEDFHVNWFRLSVKDGKIYALLCFLYHAENWQVLPYHIPCSETDVFIFCRRWKQVWAVSNHAKVILLYGWWIFRWSICIHFRSHSPSCTMV